MRPTAGRSPPGAGVRPPGAGRQVPRLSGRDNVFLNGAFLGLSRRHMAERFGRIVAFSELEQFIDTPVKHYSSGMYMRLGFAIAISVEPEILVIDEVLAVGDAAFRQKCFAALADLKQRQKTILFVTHDASAIAPASATRRSGWTGGTCAPAGPAPDVLSEYLAATGATHGQALTVAGRPADPLALPSGPVTILVRDGHRSGAPERHFVPGERIGVRVRFRVGARRPSDLGGDRAAPRGRALPERDEQRRGPPGAQRGGRGRPRCLGPLPLAARGVHRLGRAWTGDATPSHRLSQAAPLRRPPPAGSRAGPGALADVGGRGRPLPRRRPGGRR